MPEGDEREGMDGSGVMMLAASDAVAVTLDANGGTFPNGKEVVEIEPPDGYFYLPDWSVVDRPGYILTGWTSGSSRGAMAEKVTAEEGATWTAAWARDTRNYNTDHLPHAAIRIYRALDEYIDATYLQTEGGQAVVQIAEDETGSASFTLVNDYQTSGHNLLASNCSLWSSGSNGPIRPGMYVRIDSIQSDGTVEYLFDGFVTTISPNATAVSVEVGDRITFLSRQGTTLRRNYYGAENDSRESRFVSAGNDGALYADLSELPDGAVVDGTIYWTIPAVTEYANNTSIGVTYQDSSSPLFIYEFPTGGEYLGNVTLIMSLDNFHAPVDRTLTFVVASGPSSRTFSLVTDTRGEFTVSIDLDMMPCESTATVTAYVNEAPMNGNYALRVTHSTSSPDQCMVTRWTNSGLEQHLNYAVAGSVTAYTLASTSGTISGTRYYPDSIDGRDVEDEDLYNPSANRVYVPYVVSGSQSTVDVMEGIAWSMEHIPLNTDAMDDEETMVTIFRTGGGYAQDYLQKLADIASADGRMRAYLSRGYKTPVLVISGRYDRRDTSRAHIHYGGDSVTTAYGERVAFADFSPSMTLKNRPSLATLRGTISERSSSESIPLQIAVEDDTSTEARCGVLVETVVADSSVSSMGDAGQAAWSCLAENYLDEWEGNVTVPGIRRDMMDISGDHAGSGVPITITDTRNGFSAYRARVRQIRMDFNACTTILTICNYSLIHSSGIADTTALAITATDVATGDTTTTLFNSQYVRIKTDEDQNLGDGTQVTMTGIKGDGGTFTFDSVSVFSLPNGRHLVHGVAYESGSGHTADNRAYDVVAIRIGTQDQLDIRWSLRPDWYTGQTLSVDVDCP